jgi:hypothetical protein
LIIMNEFFGSSWIWLCDMIGMFYFLSQSLIPNDAECKAMLFQSGVSTKLFSSNNIGKTVSYSCCWSR